MAHDIDSEDEAPAGSGVPGTQDAGAALALLKLASYLAIAYRWGAANDHHYFVYAGADRTKALGLARAEVADRGGKYDAVVYEFTADGIDYKPVAYFAAYNENEHRLDVRHNHRKDFYERLGALLYEAASGRALLPSPADPKVLLYQPCEPLPEFLLAEVARQKKFYDTLSKVEDDRERADREVPMS